MAAEHLVRSRVLIDTNLLLVLIVGAVSPDYIARFKRTSQYDVSDLALIQQLVSLFDEVMVTPHVLTEVSNLAGHIHGDYRAQVRGALATAVKVAHEAHEPSATIVDDRAFLRLGLTDAAIARLEQGQLTVVTADFELYLCLGERGARVFNFQHIRTGAVTLDELLL